MDEELPLEVELVGGMVERAGDHFLGTLLIGGVPHHLHLFPVTEREEAGFQSALHVDHDQWFEAIDTADGHDPGDYQTIDVDGTPHVALATPYKE